MFSSYRVGSRYFVEYTDKNNRTFEAEMILGRGVYNDGRPYNYLCWLVWVDHSPSNSDDIENDVNNSLQSLIANAKPY
jgi:hypothetical protein